MAVATMRVPTIFTAVDRFSDVVSRMGAGVNRFGKNTTSALSRVDNKINGVFSSMNSLSQLAIGGGVGGLFYYAGKDIMEYEKAQASLGAVTGTVVGSMRKDIEGLGKETKRSVIEITKSFENIGSKMSEYLQNPTALREIAKQAILMSNASRMSIDDSTDNLTSILNQFKLSYKDAARVVNKLSSGEDIGASTIGESADVVRQFAASAQMAGASLEETIALVQTTTKTLGKQGVGRGFRNLMIDLNTGKGMDKNKLKALAMVNADINKIIDPATKFIDKLKEIRKLLSNKQAMGMFFKKTGFETGATFLNSFEMFEKYLSFIEKNDTAMTKAAKNTATLSYAIDILKSSFTNYIVTNNSANGALGVTKSLLAWMADNMRNIINLVLGLTLAFVGWKVIVGIVAIANGVLTAFNAVMSVHRFVVLWATMTNVGYASSLYAVAAATLAAYWPLLLVLGVLGGLVYAFWDFGDAAEESSNKQISALMDQNKAYMNSTNVLSSELGKQSNLIAKHNANVKLRDTVPKLETYAQSDSLKQLNAMDVNAANFDVQKYLQLQGEVQTMRSQNFQKNILPKFAKKEIDFSERPKNIAGTNSDNINFSKMIGNNRGELTIYLKDPSDQVKKVDQSNADGIEVKVSSTKKPNK